VTALLQLTHIQSGLEQSEPENVLLRPLVGRVCARHQGAARARAVQIESEFDCAPTFALTTNPTLLEIVLDNLLGNAVAYAPTGSTVTLRTVASGVEVCNVAPALNADDLANFGRRFWRKGAPGGGHAGLGLALASAATDAIGMRVTFTLQGATLHAILDWRAQ
jgi:two-component system sensor histidine kinase QseC